MNKNRYITECRRHLSDGSYRKINSDPTKTFEKDLFKLLDRLHVQNVLTHDMLSYAKTFNSKPARFYCLPKIHKPGVPGRPVSSCSGTLCENSSKIVDWFLKPLLSTIPSYLKDTNDFLSRVKSFGALPADCLLVTLDVVALYPSIPHSDGLCALRTFLRDADFSPELVSGIHDLTEFILTHNFFEFNNDYYLQTKGTAIGTTMAVVYSIIFMHIFERNALANSRFSPLLWLRFIDDIFMAWPYSVSELQDFVSYLNSINESIQFTYKYSENSIDFLDVVIDKNSDGVLTTDLHIKDTDTHQLLHNKSCHPEHIKRSLAFSQTIRYRRICSNSDRARFHANNLKRFLVDRGYNPKKVQAQIDKAFTIDLSSNAQKRSDDRVNLVLTFHPGLPDIAGTLRSLHEIVSHDSNLSKAFPLPPRVTFRRPKNLRDHIVRARLSSASTNFCGPCLGRSDCLLCSFLPNQQSITSHSGRVYHLECGIYANCNSTYVVYCITCTKCKVQYVGCTSKFRSRANNHKSIISRRVVKSECAKLYEHFASIDHSIQDLRFTILCCTTPYALEEKENIWKLKLDTLFPGGLNTVRATFSNRF